MRETVQARGGLWSEGCSWNRDAGLAPGPRAPTALLECAGRASASTALSLPSAIRFLLTWFLTASQSGVARRFPPHSKTLRDGAGASCFRQVLDCGSPRPLFERQRLKKRNKSLARAFGFNPPSPCVCGVYRSPSC
jgi:hypothetical protein